MKDKTTKRELLDLMIGKNLSLVEIETFPRHSFRLVSSKYGDWFSKDVNGNTAKALKRHLKKLQVEERIAKKQSGYNETHYIATQ